MLHGKPIKRPESILTVLFALLMVILLSQCGKGGGGGGENEAANAAAPAATENATAPTNQSAPTPVESAPSLETNKSNQQRFHEDEELAKRPPSAPAIEPIETIDNMLRNMRLGNIAFNAPEAMTVNQAVEIKLILGPSSSINELKQMLNTEGKKEGSQVRYTDRMRATLEGQGFVITRLTNEEQLVGSKTVTEWQWQVTAKEPGIHYLYLTLAAILNVNGNTGYHQIRTFSKSIQVKVLPFSSRSMAYIKENWLAVITGVVGFFSIVSTIVSLWRGRKKTKEDEQRNSDNV